MQIEIDFEVFKELTARLEDEADTYNEAIRRLLNLPASDLTLTPAPAEMEGVAGQISSRFKNTSGVWFSSVFLPDGTALRATYKGRTHYASISHGVWIDSSGGFRSSPSDAASAISKTSVNGWKFWFVRRPQDTDWQRLDSLRNQSPA